MPSLVSIPVCGAPQAHVNVAVPHAADTADSTTSVAKLRFLTAFIALLTVFPVVLPLADLIGAEVSYRPIHDHFGLWNSELSRLNTTATEPAG
jgi:hypothetical protein